MSMGNLPRWAGLPPLMFFLDNIEQNGNTNGYPDDRYTQHTPPPAVLASKRFHESPSPSLFQFEEQQVCYRIWYSLERIQGRVLLVKHTPGNPFSTEHLTLIVRQRKR